MFNETLVLCYGVFFWKQAVESILQNSVSATNFSDKFSYSNFGQMSTQKQQADINLEKNLGF
jgi:hypothetical protein